MEAANWVGPNIHRTSQILGLRSEASGRFEKGLSPEQALEAQALATKLMIALTGATRAARARSTSAARARPRRRSGCARRRSRDLLGMADREAAPGGDPHRARVRRRRRRRRPRRHRPALPPQRRLPRGRPRRGGRADRRPREAPDDAAQAPQRLRAPEHRAAPAPPGGRRARRPRPERDRRLELHRPRRRRPPAPRRRRSAPARSSSLENPMSEQQSVMRTMLLGSLLDAARLNVSHGQADVRLFEQGAVYAWREDREGRRRPSPTAATRAAAARTTGCRSSTAPSARCWSAACTRRAGATGEPPRAGFFADQGACSAPSATRCGSTGPSSPRPSRSCTPGAAPRILAGGEREPVGWIGELHPLVARDVRPARRGGGVRARPRPAHPPRRRRAARYRDLTSFPALRQDLAVAVADDVPAAAVVAVVRKAGGKLLADARVFDVYRGAQVGEGRTSLALAPAVPRARPHARPTTTSPRCATRSSPRCATAGGRAACLASSSPARRATPARSPRELLHRHPDFELAARHRAAATRAGGSTTSTPTTASPLTLEELDLDRHGDVDAAIVAYPHGAAAPVVAALRAKGVKVVDLSADFRLRDRRRVRALVRRAPAPRAPRRRRLRPARALPRGGPRRRPRRQPRLLPDRDDPRARPARRPHRRRRRRRQDRRLRRRAQRSASPRTSSPPTRTSRPTASAPTATCPRSTRSSTPPARRATCGSRSRRTCCRSTRASSSPAT